MILNQPHRTFQLVNVKQLSKIARRKASGQRAAKMFIPFIASRLEQYLAGQSPDHSLEDEATEVSDAFIANPRLLSRPVKQPHKWSGGAALTETAIRNLMRDEGLKPYLQFTIGRTRHSAHFSTTQVIWMISGAMVLHWPDNQEPITLRPGDRLDLPPGQLYHFDVEDTGVVYLQAKLITGR